MATNLHNLPGGSGTKGESAPARPGWGWWFMGGGLLLGLVAAGRKLFAGARARRKDIPVVHQEVTLTPEGAAAWKQAMDPNSPVGKPVHHRRRLPAGDGTV